MGTDNTNGKVNFSFPDAVKNHSLYFKTIKTVLGTDGKSRILYKVYSFDLDLDISMFENVFDPKKLPRLITLEFPSNTHAIEIFSDGTSLRAMRPILDAEGDKTSKYVKLTVDKEKVNSDTW